METKKVICCPEYDSFLIQAKPVLKQKIIDQLLTKQSRIGAVYTETINELKDLSNNREIPLYRVSLINLPYIIKLINELVDDWKGPIYSLINSEQIKPNNTNNIHRIEHDIEVMDFKKFMKRSINYIQQSSFKVFGAFFAKHMDNVQRLLTKLFPSHIVDYGCLVFASHLLKAEITLHRAGRKPLIRWTTLRDSAEIQTAFSKLHPLLNLKELKKETKAKRKAIKKYTINAQSLVGEFKTLCNQLLEDTRVRVHLPNGDGNNSSSVDKSYAVPNYCSVRGGNHIGSALKYRYNPSEMHMYTNNICGGMNSVPQTTLVVSNNSGHVVANNPLDLHNMCSLMNVDSKIRRPCSACKRDTELELCERCQRVLNDINNMDYAVLLTLMNRSVHVARQWATWFCSRFN
eukprot:1051036_1